MSTATRIRLDDTRLKLLAGTGILVLSGALVALVLRDLPGWGGDPGALLPDGDSFAYITGIDATGLLIDQAEMLSGEEARRAAIEDGVIQQGEDLPNDFYIRNGDPSSVGAMVSKEALYTVLTFDAGGEIIETEINHGLLQSIYNDPERAAEIYGFVPESFPVTLTVADGVITGFTQVYLP